MNAAAGMSGARVEKAHTPLDVFGLCRYVDNKYTADMFVPFNSNVSVNPGVAMTYDVCPITGTSCGDSGECCGYDWSCYESVSAQIRSNPYVSYCPGAGPQNPVVYIEAAGTITMNGTITKKI